MRIVRAQIFVVASTLSCLFLQTAHVTADENLATAFADADVEAALDEAVSEEGKANADDDPATKTIKELIELGGGATPISIGKKGEVESMLVVGSASIPRSLPAPKGKELAAKAARREVIKHFIRFLSEDASLFETGDSEVIIATEGSAIEDELSSNESTKVLDKSTEKFESRAQGLARGMEIIAKKVDAGGQTLYLAYGWSKENDDAADALSRRSASPKPGTSAQGGAQPPRNQLEDEEVISPRASKFFKKN